MADGNAQAFIAQLSLAAGCVFRHLDDPAK
jgi:hypothetical protein